MMCNCSLLYVFPLSSSSHDVQLLFIICIPTFYFMRIIKIQEKFTFKKKVTDWVCKIHITLFFSNID